ncbi:HAMP domain-containing sensor histidine kinase [Paenibacillus flagellatus]|uniref:Signal transduction histidine-protein kinase/phosphatase MprB n=1 Tax=Paenibacillus flagellatus TaxID=2211139 RepID=A0A2V5JYU4_9BACL|nr:HAMP domain-containing sensor histidine kinase [Paenibacillus flagellatus]PYI52065.1 two-component sensor histidine kinase [Paenibacillus flagellatus]
MKSTSILSYWTYRYLLILCVGLVLVATAAAVWVRQTTMDSRMRMTGLLAQEIAERVSSEGSSPVIPESLDALIEKRKRFFNLSDELCVTITGNGGVLLYADRAMSPGELRSRLTEDLSESADDDYVTVSSPVVNKAGATIGHVTLLQSKKALTFIPNENRLLAVLLTGLAALGWLTIYLLSRKLSRPIRQVAEAARQVSQGRYDVRLEGEWREREIGELVGSFKHMAARLKQLEDWRALMLAGLTHELKTPVTSVKGLIHAVRERVVDGQEADEFLDIALKETGRLQSMVSDLLDYNALASGFVKVRRDELNATALVAEIVHQWNVMQDGEETAAVPELPEANVPVAGDALRIQQIVVNLLNNAKDARVPGRPLRIAVGLRREAGGVEVVVSDNGQGIPEEERGLVFERFFRGERKRDKVRGLGLGLTFSRMLACAMDGDLRLVSSSAEGTVFALRLPAGGR